MVCLEVYRFLPVIEIKTWNTRPFLQRKLRRPFNKKFKFGPIRGFFYVGTLVDITVLKQWSYECAGKKQSDFSGDISPVINYLSRWNDGNVKPVTYRIAQGNIGLPWPLSYIHP
jgi:hypothetical protein